MRLILSNKLAKPRRFYLIPDSNAANMRNEETIKIYYKSLSRTLESFLRAGKYFRRRSSFRVSPHVRLLGDIFYPRGTSKLRSFESAKVLRPFSYDPRIVFHRSDEPCHRAEMIMFGKRSARRFRQRSGNILIIFLVTLRFLATHKIL